jgi:tripartite-type tricarboxylate transporter receptor subunit TctC
MNLKVGLIYSAITFLLIGFSACGQANQQSISPGEYYKSKNIELITTGSTGGYDDLLAHIVAENLEKDSGSIVTVSNKQGAGGMEGTNFLYKDEPDGLSMGEVAATKFIGNKIMADPTAEYDIEKFSYILSIGHEQMYFLVSPEGPYQSTTILQSATKIKLGAGSASGNVSLAGLTIIKLLNLDAKVVTGFKNESDRALAVKRGEIAGYFMNLAGAREGLAAGLVKPLFVLSSHRDPIKPDIPAVSELVEVTGDNMDLLKFWEDSFVSSSIFIAPPAIDTDKLLFLRSLANNWGKDEGFRQQIDQAAGHQIMVYDTGDQVAQNMTTLSMNLTKFQSTFATLIEKYRE